MSSSAVHQVVLSGSLAIDALVYGFAWDDPELSYSFPDTSAAWSGYGPTDEPAVGFYALTAEARAVARSALAYWIGIADVQISEANDGEGTLRLGFTGLGMNASQLAYTYTPGAAAEPAGDIWLNAQLKDSVFDSFASGDLGGFVLLHELGHALGLKHPHGASPVNSSLLGRGADSLFDSVMSYYAWPGTALTKTNIDRFPTSPMALDIDAIQYLYGPNLSSHDGDDLYRYDSCGRYLETLYDTGGVDTIAVEGSAGARIDLRPGNWSEIGLPVKIRGGLIEVAHTIRIHKSTLIEQACGGGGVDTLIGNDAKNLLTGGAGNDVLVGGMGDDTLEGGSGQDRMAGGSGADRFVFSDLNKHGRDTILDFAEEDSLVFETDAFVSLVGADANNFAIGHARDAGDYLVYKPSTRTLYYDADGTDDLFRPIKLALIKGSDSMTLTFDDFLFI